MKILREDEVTLTVFQMIGLWEEGCRCAARAVGLSEDSVEEEERAQALVIGILVIPQCPQHDPDHADGPESGGKVDGVVAAMVGDVQVLLPSYATPPTPTASTPTGGVLSRLSRRARQLISKGPAS